MPTTMNQVAVFWDYENCRPPSNASGYGIMSEIRKLAQQYGHIKTCRGYADLSELSSPRSVTLRSELQCSGLSLIDCPHNGRKNVVDQMMIVDMLTFAIDNDSNGSTIILISGDRDFAYPVSILRFRMYQVIVVSPSTPGAHISLRSQASTLFDWNTVIASTLRDDRSPSDSDTPPNGYVSLPPANAIPNNTGRFNSYNSSATFRPQHRNRPEASPSVPRSEAPVVPIMMDNTPPVYAAAVTANDAILSPVTSPLPQTSELPPVAQYVHDGLQKQMTGDSNVPFLPSAPPTLPSPPAPPIPSVLLPPSSTPSSSQGQPNSPGTWTIPPHFRSLVLILQDYQDKGEKQPLRSSVALELVKQDSKVYEKAGVTKFRSFIDLAVKEGLIGLGGSMTDAWISLNDDIVNRLRYNPLI